MRVSVIIPTLNAAPWLERQLVCLLRQTVATEIIVIDSGSDNATLEILGKFKDSIRLFVIGKKSFDHGGTRDFAVKQCKGDFLLFLSQDAIPANEYYIEKLLEPFSDDRVAGVFGRQIAWSDAPKYEKLIRIFNYPQESRVWSERDISRYGIKAYFFSNTCSAIRRSAYECVGGFDKPIITNEDMMLAAKLLHAGWKLAYQPEAKVWHSHRETLLSDYRRNARIGEVIEQYRDRLVGADSPEEGKRLVQFVCKELARKKEIGSILEFLSHAVSRFAGYRRGKRMAQRRRKHHENADSAVEL
ncbi:MAG: glycosyltransferase [Oscillospiraceae bacterium]|nr:glycosyltransferase [Oscillospiraceae bacterium]